jgi:hypothetical protein
MSRSCASFPNYKSRYDTLLCDQVFSSVPYSEIAVWARDQDSLPYKASKTKLRGFSPQANYTGRATAMDPHGR